MEHNGSKSRRRSLILAGGGLKVAFQAGVLQVWLDEAELEFDHVDAASGGVFNLAMLCQGMSGGEIADNWRGLPARSLLDINWRRPLRLVGGESIARLHNLRRKLFPLWGIDFERIRSSPLDATFNTYNFTRHELEVIPPARLTEDLLVSCVSLPMWFPQVEVGGETYIDSVFITDANVEEAIRRGADELWIVWTVSERSEWQRGFIGNYFSIIETAANGHFRRILRRIEESNAAIERGEQGEFGRTIDVHLLRGEVPLHYLLNLSGDRFSEAVERGVDAGRRWCEERGIPLRPREERPRGPATRISFTETMAGSVVLGATDFDATANGGGSAKPLSVTLTITADDLERFMFSPAHEARVEGHVQCEDLGGRLPVERGTFNLFVDDGDPAHKRMRYRLHFRDGVGHPLTLAGHKVIETETGRGLWRDTTTLYTRVLKGHVDAGGDDAAEPVASGIIRITPLLFARQLTTFRASGPSAAASMAGLMRFGTLFAGGLWDVYARRVLSSSPV
jgi:predicted acylesterase/phospholipase RssA